MLKQPIILLYFWCLGLSVFAQQKDEQLAAQYFGNNEFDKAADLYEKLLNKTGQSGYYYENLLLCYFKLNRFDDAEKMVKKQVRRNEDNAYYPVDLGYVYKKAGRAEKAKKEWDEVISKLKPGEMYITETANAFQKRGETDLAIGTYLRGRKINGNSISLFAIPLAQLYGEKKETRMMCEEYLNALQNNPSLIEDVEGYLQLFIENNADYQILKTSLIKKSKDFPGNEVYNEMLIWLYVQRKDFDNAFIHAKAIDKRYKEEGRRLIDLGYLACANEKFDAAAFIFAYVATAFGNTKPYYLNARTGMLDAKNKKVFFTGNYSAEDIKILETDYLNYIQEFGKTYFTASAMRELARLRIYHLKNFETGIALFNEIIELPRLDNKFKAECKLELGDIYVLKGEEWEGMLLYGQVDKDFLEDPLGQEAKFRNARLSYYLGEFEWARAQLDVLKTATTQLIANNALELSLLIQDNTIDSIEDPLELFARADLYYFQNQTAAALMLLDSIDLLFPRHALADDVLFKRSEICIKQRNYSKATGYLEQLLKEHGSGILGDNALYTLAYITEVNLADREQAKKLYEQFMNTFPGSFFITEVRKRYRALRGDNLIE
ncbi:MAG: tetratricopeptide repeat protein [Bacteroidota bacterium]|jgi:tetratricopeptide (TPR) repeat protein|nr:tetratricopeptide repeat protein [Sphingobacteriales bacterium]